jgi:hypothetical protein
MGQLEKQQCEGEHNDCKGMPEIACMISVKQVAQQHG